MIHEVDDALRKLVLEHAVNGSGAEISFEAPTKDWAARRNTPTVSVYLYDVREDLERRETQFEAVLDESGRVVERRPPPRRYKLSYLVTCWTQRPEDEHRLLSSLMACFLRYETLPKDVLSGVLAETPYRTFVSIALPPPKDRSLADVWSALGGELKPSLDLVVTAPFDSQRITAAGPPVLEEPRIAVVTAENGKRAEGEPPSRGAEEQVVAPAKGKKGAAKGKAAAAKGAPAEDAAAEGAEAPPAGASAEEGQKPPVEETIVGGKKDQPGRIITVRDIR